VLVLHPEGGRAMSRELAVVDLGRLAYPEAEALQRSLAAQRLERILEHDVLLLLEHPPVITLGRGSRHEHLLASPEALAARGVHVFETDRGGDVTFHGPGQLVGYPIYDLTEHRTDLHWFLRTLEEALMRALARLDLAGERKTGYTGVWVGPRKIASIGIHVRQWVTWHGFALNVLTDLSYFDLIVPCGIADVSMTSIQRELGERTPQDVWARTLEAVMLGFAEAFDQRPRVVGLEDLTPALPSARKSARTPGSL
jgi:lipoyl(octanoyl) transferase